MVAVGPGGGSVEDVLHVRELRHLHQALDALVRGGDLQTAGAGQTVGVRVDAYYRRDLQRLDSRRILIIRSVPMFPEPMTAALVRVLMRCVPPLRTAR